MLKQKLPYLNNVYQYITKEKKKVYKVIYMYNRLLFPAIYHFRLTFINCHSSNRVSINLTRTQYTSTA